MPGGTDTTNQARRGEVDEALVNRLRAIASPNRLELLSLLREPTAVADVELEATGDQGEKGRPISRQGVRHHLNKLRKAGFVETTGTDVGGKRVHRYVTEPRRLYELAESLRTMAGGGERDAEEGSPLSWDAPASAAPTLTVVHGGEIGRTFRLRPEPERPGRGWVLGRGQDVDVPLEWDPAVDRQAGEIELRGDEMVLVDLRATPNRLSLNGNVFRRGESRTIEDGDIVGVGQSLLRFQR